MVKNFYKTENNLIVVIIFNSRPDEIELRGLMYINIWETKCYIGEDGVQYFIILMEISLRPEIYHFYPKLSDFI